MRNVIYRWDFGCYDSDDDIDVEKEIFMERAIVTLRSYLCYFAIWNNALKSRKFSQSRTLWYCCFSSITKNMISDIFCVEYSWYFSCISTSRPIIKGEYKFPLEFFRGICFVDYYAFCS